MAGYSGTPLPQKLGIKPSYRVAFVHAPKDFTDGLGSLPLGVDVVDKVEGNAPLNVIVFFVRKRSELEQGFRRMAGRLDPNGGLWVAWPKRSSGVVTDVNENTVRDIALAVGLVDNKVCAIDETWSGLRCVVRLKDRPAKVATARRSSPPKR
jgi:hypothetical protein